MFTNRNHLEQLRVVVGWGDGVQVGCLGFVMWCFFFHCFLPSPKTDGIWEPGSLLPTCTLQACSYHLTPLPLVLGHLMPPCLNGGGTQKQLRWEAEEQVKDLGNVPVQVGSVMWPYTGWVTEAQLLSSIRGISSDGEILGNEEKGAPECHPGMLGMLCSSQWPPFSKVTSGNVQRVGVGVFTVHHTLLYLVTRAFAESY